MPETTYEIADAADMIVGGYAFNKSPDGVRVVNILAPQRVSVMTMDGRINETSMDDIELRLVRQYLERNKRFLEPVDA